MQASIPMLRSASLLILLLARAAQAADPLHLCVAASLGDAATRIVESYAEENGVEVRVNAAASGLLVSQTLHGAPCDVLVTADEQSLKPLVDAKALAEGFPQPLLTNSLVVIGPLEAEGAQPGWISLLVMERVERIALGEPDSVPAGRYARTALARSGIWDRLQPKMVPALDVRAVLALVAGGEADVGFVYRTDAAIEPRVRILFEVPESLSGTIRYPLAVIVSSSQPHQAAGLARHLRGSRATAVFQQFGFSPAP